MSNSKEKEVKEQYIIDKELFAEVELSALSLINNKGDVTDIFRSPIKEIVNTRQKDTDDIYKAKIISTFTDDNGVEKKNNYFVLCFASGIEAANNTFKNYMLQGMDDMVLDSISKTKILDLIK
jgi:hypothetical protein